VAKLLYLVHRLPYPPNKGDKVRSFHLLKHLAQSNDIYLGTFIDDPDDWQYASELEQYCSDLCIVDLNPRLSKLKSLSGLLTGDALTIPYYRNHKLQAWVSRILKEQSIAAIVVFSSAMAQYVPSDFDRPVLVDFVDVDSAKWSQYASAHLWPMSWIYRREGSKLLSFEKAIARRANRSFFVTENEVNLFADLAPECASHVEPIMNGVDSDFFQPAMSLESPYPTDAQVLVFTGAMDYWPNIDAVTWFANDIFPTLKDTWPQLLFYIVGRSPTTAVANLAGNGIVVTGTVPDVRPYLQFADVVVAPLRVARGVQNKILEAMAMACPVVAAASCIEAIGAESGREVLAAKDVSDYLAAINRLLSQPEESTSHAAAARTFVVDRYSWEAHLSKIDRHLGVA
jgi:sugar transferase (PEP-CTERM/EpsH1 system associated)